MMDPHSPSEPFDSFAHDTPPTPPKMTSSEGERPSTPNKPNASQAHGCFKGCLITSCIVIVLLVTGFVACSVLATKGVLQAISSLYENVEPSFSLSASGLEEVWADHYQVAFSEVANPRKVIHLKLNGTIDVSSEGGHIFRGENSAAQTLRAIRRAKEDGSVDAILLEVDSGGGGITASDILYHELVRFKEQRKGRVVIVLMGDMAASGAYYVSLAADRIVAHPTTITGSIGVILPAVNVQQLTDRLGVVDQSITSGQNKAILNPMRELTEEQRALLQGTVDELYERFALLVSQHRNIPLEEVKRIADGRLYTANQAKQLQLVDEIGYYENAKELLYQELNFPDEGFEIYEYEQKSSLRNFLSSPDFWGAAVARIFTAGTEMGSPFRVR